MKGLSPAISKQFVELVEALRSRRGVREAEWIADANRVYAVKNNSDNFALAFCQKLKKVDKLLTEIHNKNLISTYTGPDMRTNSEAEEFLIDLDIVCCIVADRFVLGVLQESL